VIGIPVGIIVLIAILVIEFFIIKKYQEKNNEEGAGTGAYAPQKDGASPDTSEASKGEAEALLVAANQALHVDGAPPAHQPPRVPEEGAGVGV